MDTQGIYYSSHTYRGSLKDSLLPAIYDHSHKEELAHFGSSGVIEVIKYSTQEVNYFAYVGSKEKYFILPKDLIVWKDH